MSIVNFLHSVSNSVIRRRSVSVHSPLRYARRNAGWERFCSSWKWNAFWNWKKTYLDAAASATALAAVASSNFFLFFSSASCFSAVARASCSPLSFFSSCPTVCLSFCFACTALWSLTDAHRETRGSANSTQEIPVLPILLDFLCKKTWRKICKIVKLNLWTHPLLHRKMLPG